MPIEGKRRMWAGALVVLGLAGCNSKPPAQAGQASGRMAVNAIAGADIADINADHSDGSDADGATGGRVNGVGRTASGQLVYYAATEWGGLYNSTDSGRTWARINSHLPMALWRVQVDPTDSKRVYTTSFYDGRFQSTSGINVSTDGGRTWTHPAQMPADGSCAAPERREELSAFGMAIDPDHPQNVYVGTTCGLAMSIDRGANWRFVNPSKAGPANQVWDVVVHHNGIIDLCGEDGYRRSIDGGRTFKGEGIPSVSQCSIAISPLESSVIFVYAAGLLYESDDAGANWKTVAVPEPKPGRSPFVATNQRDGKSFDLWFGDVSLYSTSCSGPPVGGASGPPSRCTTAWSKGYTRDVGGHDDAGEVAFGADGCPILLASDGGVYRNTATGNPDCQKPHWAQPDVTPHALWVFSMDTAYDPRSSAPMIYLVNQDSGTFFSPDARTPRPQWNNRECCDGFNVVSLQNRVAYTFCCYDEGRRTTLFILGADMVGTNEVKSYPNGASLLEWHHQVLARFGSTSLAVATDQGVFAATNVAASPVKWNLLGEPPVSSTVCGIQSSVGSGNTPVFYGQTFHCDDQDGDFTVGGLRPVSELLRINGASRGGQWSHITPPEAGASLWKFAVSPVDANRLVACFVRVTGEPFLTQSMDGGRGWSALRQLDSLMTQNGQFRYWNRVGPTDFTSFYGYVQPTLLAFDPDDPQILLAGGAGSGLFLSVDSGGSWKTLADGYAIPQPRVARFDHKVPGRFSIYVATQGRGVWRIGLPTPH